MSRTDAALGVLLLLGAASLFAAAMRLPAGVSSDPLGPRGFPVVLAAGLAMCGVALLFDALFVRRGGAGGAEEDAGAFSATRFGGAIALSAAYVVALQPAGFLVATPFYVGGLILLQGGVPLGRMVLLAIGFPLALFALFSLALRVSIPLGILEDVLR